VDAEARKLALTFHTQLAVGGRDGDYLDLTTVRERRTP
jgi:hypothetical protein